ncbi:hypothetical protein [Morganella psychrotolerans]|uniref:Uncharacterized protein n=1 Tax=Morganella psychrotolerans TaxID=368603 RepID=A0A1B8H893_9GAMM|nr:hypothetical protein [Morganella psychrotolerans]OBU05286.1 hypothetical protein AYY18_20130 [Morganella psychrotolerans]
MNAYAMQDAQEERRLENAAWQDAVNDAQCMDANEFMDGLPEHILSPEMEKIMEPIFTKNGKSLDALLEGIRNAYLIGRDQ